MGENIRGDSWTSRHRQLQTFSQDTEYVYLSTFHPAMFSPLEPQLIWLFMWSSKRHFSAVNQKPAAVSRMFSAWIKDPVLWAGEAVHRQTQIGKFAGNLGQNMWLILILLSSKTGEIDCPAAGPRDTAGARLSPAVIRCRPVQDVSQLSPAIILMSGVAHDGGILQSWLFTSRSQNLVSGKLRRSGFWS